MSVAQRSERVADKPNKSKRCSVRDLSFGRCQLQADHDSAHAVYLGGDVCVTWEDRGDKSLWRVHPCPPWLASRPWAPGHGLPLN